MGCITCLYTVCIIDSRRLETDHRLWVLHALLASRQTKCLTLYGHLRHQIFLQEKKQLIFSDYEQFHQYSDHVQILCYHYKHYIVGWFNAKLYFGLKVPRNDILHFFLGEEWKQSSRHDLGQKRLWSSPHLSHMPVKFRYTLKQDLTLVLADSPITATGNPRILPDIFIDSPSPTLQIIPIFNTSKPFSYTPPCVRHTLLRLCI